MLRITAVTPYAVLHGARTRWDCLPKKPLRRPMTRDCFRDFPPAADCSATEPHSLSDTAIRPFVGVVVSVLTCQSHLLPARRLGMGTPVTVGLIIPTVLAHDPFFSTALMLVFRVAWESPSAANAFTGSAADASHPPLCKTSGSAVSTGGPPAAPGAPWAVAGAAPAPSIDATSHFPACRTFRTDVSGDLRPSTLA